MDKGKIVTEEIYRLNDEQAKRFANLPYFPPPIHERGPINPKLLEELHQMLEEFNKNIEEQDDLATGTK